MPQDGGCLLLPIAPGPEGSCTDLWKRGEGEERKRRGEEEGGGGRQGKMGRREEKGEWGKREEEGRKEKGREKGRRVQKKKVKQRGYQGMSSTGRGVHRLIPDLLQGSLPMSVHKFMRGFTMMGMAMMFSMPGRSSGLR